ncbi:MAG: right-handed parallel beta-helix repeat-containing protein [Nitrosospira sp.]
MEANDIYQSAVSVIGDRVWSLPIGTYAAIYTGTFSNIIDNHIDTSAANGIWPVGNGMIANGIVERNAILNSCLQMNDCGAIYINYASPNTRIASNLIERVNSDIDGVIVNATSHAVGIYIDANSTNTTVENNAIAWADYGILLHDSYSNRVIGNLLHGNRKSQLWLQEQTNKIISTGDLQDNEMSSNRFFSTTSFPSVIIDGGIGSLTNFGILSKNYYSSLFSKRVVNESWPTHNLTYTLSEWQGASGEGRTSQDLGSSQLVQEGYATYLAVGNNIVPNGGLKDGMRGWSSWNATAPLSTRVYETCPFGPCLRITAGGSETIASTPNFSVEAGRAYRVTFDARTSTDGQFIAPLVRRGGPLYDRLMPASQGFSGSVEWRRYSFVFTAAMTVNEGDPITGDLGARVDFERILPGQTFWIANVEIVPLQNVENTLRTQFVANPDRVTQSHDCPDRETAPEYCDRYRIFPEGTQVNWPIDLPSLSAISMYTINRAMLDTDNDGTADSADLCPGTLRTDQVNASGCALTQIPKQ